MKTKLLLLVIAMNIINCQNVLAQLSRLKATGFHYYGTSSFAPTDSTVYVYTGGNGGDFNTLLKYTTDTDWSYSSSVYTPYSVQNQTFNASDNIATTTKLIYTSGSFVNSTLQTRTFDASNNCIGILMQNWDAGTSTWKNSQKSDFVYDGSGKRIAHTDYNWNTTSSAFVPYNHDTTITVSSSISVLLQFDWDVVTGHFINLGNDTVSYDGSGYVLSDVGYIWNSGSSTWKKSQLVQYYNNSTGKPLRDTVFTWQTAPPSWQYLAAYNFNYDGSGSTLMEEYIQLTSGVWKKYYQYLYTYNSYHQITSFAVNNWDTVSSSYKVTTGSGLYYYYYELYTGVPLLNNLSVDVNVFPNPANRILQVHIKWDVPQPFVVTVYDMKGRVMSNYREEATTNYNRQVPTDYWPAGNYMVVVKTNSGSTIRQFVVRH